SYPNVPPSTPLLLSSAIGSGGYETYYNNRYQNGVDIQPGYLQSLYGYGTIQAADQLSALQQYLDAKENVYAAYGQYEMTVGPLGIVGGVRVERTTDNSSAYETSKDGTVVTPVGASNSYTNAFPSLQGKYEIQPDLITRATWSSTIARPGFNQSNVSKIIDFGSGQVTQGNPNLKPATANSFDLSTEKYLQGAGILSFGIFDKQIKNYIVPDSTGVVVINQLQLRTYTYNNAGSSFVRGAEFNYEQRFPNLPGLLSGLGVGANYTFVDSRFQIRPGEYSQLPSTSKNTWNATLFYEHDSLGLRLAAYSTSQDLFAIGSDRTGDVYNATRTSMDFGSTYAVADHWVAYFNAKNLLDTPHRFYMGTSDRTIQREFYGQTYQIGLRFDY
ncbi:MAG: TonB-dependent receptor, partial [Gammaproteobacteria bacterium]|nr:TonB-dependent receptor [Gammaproteobacteria bacterium]